MQKSIHFTSISGSLGKESFNTCLLSNHVSLLPELVTTERISSAADALVFVSFEYNYSTPGGLKNVIDSPSRGEDSPLSKKPVSVMGITPGLCDYCANATSFSYCFSISQYETGIQTRGAAGKRKRKI